MIRRPPRSTQSRSSAASDVYKRQDGEGGEEVADGGDVEHVARLLRLHEVGLPRVGGLVEVAFGAEHERAVRPRVDADDAVGDRSAVARRVEGDDAVSYTH